MKKILSKNYIILIVLLVVTVFLTLFLSNLYTAKNKLVSNFYEYANKITPQEFDEYIVENPDTIIYISDKYDLAHETFETKFENKIESLNLREKLVFMDKENITQDFLSKIKNTYGINIEIENLPMLVIVIDNTVTKNIYIENYLNVETIIDYEVFQWLI